MTLVPNETEQALNRQYDVYAAAREEYRKKIAELAAQNEKLRAALRQVAAYKADDDEMDWADAVLTMNAIARAALDYRKMEEGRT